MEQHLPKLGGVRMAGRQVQDAGPHASLRASVAPGPGFALHDQDRTLGAGGADADQCGAADPGHGGEDGFDLVGVEVAAGGADPFRFASGEPEPSLLVEPADVTHPVPDAVPVADPGQRGRLRIVQIGVADGGGGHSDLPDGAGRHDQILTPPFDRIVADGDDAYLGAREWRTQAGARPCGGGRGVLGEQAALDRGHRHAFGGAVHRQHPRVVAQAAAQAVHHRHRQRRPGGHHVAKRVQHQTMGGAVTREPVQQRGSGEHPGHAIPLDVGDQGGRVGPYRMPRVHVRDDHGRPERRRPQGERRERRQHRRSGSTGPRAPSRSSCAARCR